MKKLTILLFGFLFLALGLISSAKADIIEPGKKGVTTCIYIDNYEEYQGYKFYLAGDLLPYVVEIEPDRCAFQYKLSNWYIVAVPVEESKGVTIEDMSDIDAISGVYKSRNLDIDTYREVSEFSPVDTEDVKVRVSIDKLTNRLDYEIVGQSKSYSWTLVGLICLCCFAGVFIVGVAGGFVFIKMRKKDNKKK